MLYLNVQGIINFGCISYVQSVSHRLRIIADKLSMFIIAVTIITSQKMIFPIRFKHDTGINDVCKVSTNNVIMKDTTNIVKRKMHIANLHECSILKYLIKLIMIDNISKNITNIPMISAELRLILDFPIFFSTQNFYFINKDAKTSF